MAGDRRRALPWAAVRMPAVKLDFTIAASCFPVARPLASSKAAVAAASCSAHCMALGAGAWAVDASAQTINTAIQRSCMRACVSLSVSAASVGPFKKGTKQQSQPHMSFDANSPARRMSLLVKPLLADTPSRPLYPALHAQQPTSGAPDPPPLACHLPCPAMPLRPAGFHMQPGGPTPRLPAPAPSNSQPSIRTRRSASSPFPCPLCSRPTYIMRH